MNGIVGLETAFAVCLELVRKGALPERRLVEALTVGPARAFGLAGGDALARGGGGPRGARPRRGVGGGPRAVPLEEPQHAVEGEAARRTLRVHRRGRPDRPRGGQGGAMTKRAILALADGTTFEGISFGAAGESIGEVVFNTSMTGYQEIITDPSYVGQMVCMTYPEQGNYGVTRADEESARPHATGFIVRHHAEEPSNFRAEQSLDGYLKRARDRRDLGHRHPPPDQAPAHRGRADGRHLDRGDRPGARRPRPGAARDGGAGSRDADLDPRPATSGARRAPTSGRTRSGARRRRRASTSSPTTGGSSGRCCGCSPRRAAASPWSRRRRPRPRRSR